MKTTLLALTQAGMNPYKICHHLQYELGEIGLRQFPDEEIVIKIKSDVAQRRIILFESLDRPNAKLVPLLFAANTARTLGAQQVGLIAPYLAYMRQDKQFQPGEGISSQYFASILSQHFDWMMTVAPHLHRFHTLNAIYSIPTTVLHASIPIAQWINSHVHDPIIIGPDQESKQWVAEIAQIAQAPFVVLNKERLGDRSVKITAPQLDAYKSCTPVFIDDIISTATTLIAGVNQLKILKMKPPICIGVHAVFSGNAYYDLLNAGVAKVVTCNTIPHSSNMIDLSSLVINELKVREK